MGFGQVVVGPPGSGKTTFCHGMAQLLRHLKRNVVIVNLDPANEEVPYEADIDIRDLVSLERVMEELDLGPNGGLLYCMDYLEVNSDWLLKEMDKRSPAYFLIDCPGQAELYTHCTSIQKLMRKLERADHRLVSVHLVDAHHCSDASKFISAALLSLTTQLRLELPAINVLSKVDLIEVYGKLHYGLQFYTDMMDVTRLLDVLHDPSEGLVQASRLAQATRRVEKTSVEGEKKESRSQEAEAEARQPSSATDAPHPRLAAFQQKFRGLHKAIARLVEDYSLVGFHTVQVEDKESMVRVLRSIDKANGYIMGAALDEAGGDEGRKRRMAMDSVLVDREWDAERVGSVEERYTSAFLSDAVEQDSGV